ncbi:MAG TPA: HmuY family protein [Longimicrobiales bacterium]
MRSLRSYIPRASVLALAVLIPACDDGSPTEPQDESAQTLTVDASQGWTFVDLGEPARVVQIADPTTSPDWDIAFSATAVMLNGGAAGPGGVVGHCICQNASATNAQLQAMTPESELADFEAVTAAQIPTDDSDWQSDALVPAISDWYRYDFQTHRVSPASDKVWLIRAAEGVAYAKFRVVGIEGASQANAGKVTFEFAVQAAKGAPMGAAQTATVDLSSGGKVYFDLVKGAVSDASDWDLVFEGYTIRVNGGVSGSGQAGAVAMTASFDEITDASQVPSYPGDAYGGVFDSHRWYRYNITGSDHQVWPTYDVYLIKRGTEVYKLQITSYYGPAGEARRVTFRYARLTN